MALDIYGGDPRIIATQQELLRAMGCLQLAINELEAAVFASPEMVFDFVPNPLPNLQLAFLLPNLTQRLQQLRNGLQVAAESYFSTEAQITRLLSNIFRPVTDLNWFMVQPNPVSGALMEQVSRTAAAMAVVGLTGVPSSGKAQLVGQASRLAVATAGGISPQQLLAKSHANSLALGIKVDVAGSARMVSSQAITPARNIYGFVARLQNHYWSPISTIRIEVFQRPGGRDLVVYVPGTQSFLPGSSNPLNIQSNLTAMGGVVSAPSQQAVSDALGKLGAGPRDRVLFVGHSQGALLAGNLASTEQPYEVKGLISLGGPIAHLDLNVPVIAIQHAADPVPQLSGTANPMRENWVTVSSSQSFGSLVDAHRISSYTNTAAELAGSTNDGYQRVMRQLIPEGVAGKEFLFEIRRD
jgi:hypothetical protein